MAKIRIDRIIAVVVVMLILLNRKRIIKAMEPVFEWFGESLQGLHDFPEGAQAAIAFLTLVMVAVFVFKTINNNRNSS